VINESGTSVKEDYLLDCCYVIGFLISANGMSARGFTGMR
jgi:hypothetical protein